MATVIASPLYLRWTYIYQVYYLFMHMFNSLLKPSTLSQSTYRLVPTQHFKFNLFILIPTTFSVSWECQVVSYTGVLFILLLLLGVLFRVVTCLDAWLTLSTCIHYLGQLWWNTQHKNWKQNYTYFKARISNISIHSSLIPWAWAKYHSGGSLGGKTSSYHIGSRIRNRTLNAKKNLKCQIPVIHFLHVDPTSQSFYNLSKQYHLWRYILYSNHNRIQCHLLGEASPNFTDTCSPRTISLSFIAKTAQFLSLSILYVNILTC